MANYIALIHKEADSDYGVSFPDFPGCVTAGNTLEEARSMAEESLELHIEGLIEDGEDIPAPSPLDQIIHHPDYADSVAQFMVEADTDQTVRINITLKASELKIIDAVCRETGSSRSALLVSNTVRRCSKAEQFIQPYHPFQNQGMSDAGQSAHDLAKAALQKLAENLAGHVSHQNQYELENRIEITNPANKGDNFKGASSKNSPLLGRKPLAKNT